MEKKIPLRKCLGCNEMKPKKELKRIVKTKDGEIFIDETGKANGRGTYVCSKECVSKIMKKKSLDRTFETNVDASVYENLYDIMTKLESEDNKNE